MSVRPAAQQLLQALDDDLVQPNPYPEGASEAEDAWIAREYADGWPAGPPSRVTAHGGVARDEVEEGRALFVEAGAASTRADGRYDLLLRGGLQPIACGTAGRIDVVGTGRS